MGGVTAVFVHGVPETPAVWHGLLAALDFAKMWQTPQAGEDFWDQQLAAPAEERAGVFQMFGVPEEPALDLASHINRTMAGCILDLYRSAVDVGTQWGPDFAAIPAPGLAIIPSEEPFMSVTSSTRAAARAGARTAALDGLGHWWMLQDPVRAASVLREFWATPA